MFYEIMPDSIMCGRFALSVKTDSVEKLLPNLKIDGDLIPRFNIAPTQDIAVIKNDSHNVLSYVRWGLIPFWAKDSSFGSKLINARAETISEKSSFKTPFKKRRCLILADAFYEWRKIPGQKKKQPYLIRMKDKSVFTFAGLWDKWVSQEKKTVESATIITTAPNEMMETIHDRMPAILLPTDRNIWIEADNPDEDILKQLLMPYPQEEMEAFPISELVNSPQNETKQIQEPLNQLL